MCGICGIIRFDEEPFSEEKIKRMMSAMKHRGPDDEGIHIEQNIGLGFVRLSIIDLSANGHQPMTDATGQYVIILNGEIYNYIELRDELRSLGYKFRSRSDTEVLLYSFIEWGPQSLDRLNGMFAFAVLNKREKSIFLARDRFGIKPLYYFQDNNVFIFGSEIPPILEVYGVRNEPDYQSIFDYLAYNRTDQSEKTFFKGIKKLSHGSYLIIKNNTVKIKRWYEIRKNLDKPSLSSEQYLDLLISSINIHMRSDVPIGVCLSGGIDSSSITSILLRENKTLDLATFSAVYNKGLAGDESEYINEYTSVLKNMNYAYPTAESLLIDQGPLIKAHAEPFPSTSIYAQYMVMKLAHGKVKVLIDGQGADEQLAGYHYFFGYYFKELLQSLRWMRFANEVYHYLKNHKSAYALKILGYLYLPESFALDYKENNCAISGSFRDQIITPTTHVRDLIGSRTLKDSLINHFEYKLEHLLKWEDRNSMWFSIESRVPFLDYRLVEATLSQESEKMIFHGQTKVLLRTAVNGLVPERIRIRKDKIGFQTPEDSWFRTKPYREFIFDLLGSEDFKTRGIINPRKALKMYSQHLAKDINISKEVWKWINLELWFRQYIDN
jgi:asparagine synthase (glutamine-hydrolysing)